MEVALNKSQPLLTETLPNGATFIVMDKPRIEHAGGNVTGFCLDLRYWYDRKGGFVERKVRTDKEVINLSYQWLERITKGEK